MKNGKHTIIRLIRLIRGQKNKRLTEREARLTLKMGVSGFQVQDTHNASCFTNMTWIGLNLPTGKLHKIYESERIIP